MNKKININKVKKNLSLSEKLKLLTGEDVLDMAGNSQYGITALKMTDGPHGVRLAKGTESSYELSNIDGGDTCFPTASALGASWNTELAYKVGAAIARDCRQENLDVLLAPGVNMKRTPHCGRNFEYFSEDPVLSGMLGAAFINGVHSEGVGTSLKHFAVNNQETKRWSINAEVDERTLREYYLRVFEIVLENSNPTSVMCAYNKLNGIWCSENKYLLTKILREEWHYTGMVVSN